VAGSDLLSPAGKFAAGQRLEHERRNYAEAEQGDFFGLGIHADDLLSQKHKAEGNAGSRQKLCVRPQAGGATGRSAATRPSGARNAGQPNRCNRRSANRKRWAAIQPIDCSMCKARTTKLDATTGAVNAASAAHMPSACFRKRRIQNWPRW